MYENVDSCRFSKIRVNMDASSEEVKTFRLSLGMSQVKFGLFIKCSPTTIYKIEKGEYNVSPLVRYRIIEKMKEFNFMC